LGQRTWNLWHIASLWVGMSVCIPTVQVPRTRTPTGHRELLRTTHYAHSSKAHTPAPEPA
ncbi:MAG: hypothetical protein ACRD08_07895, partial [Acidimicrobiales bacterium]